MATSPPIPRRVVPTYDAVGRTACTTNDTTFTLDALGRIAGRTINGTTDAFDFVGASETVTAIATGATTLQSIVGPTGDRLGISDGTTRNWFVPDPHGSIGGALSENEATVVSAIRYDGWGETIGTGTAGGTAVASERFRYQGRLDLSPTGLGTPLYEFSARNYAPGIASFTSLDAVMGSATDPLSMHRYLYAEANPTSLIDPTGHGTECQMGVTCSAELRMVEQRSRQRYERRVTERRRTDFVRRQSRARPIDRFSVPTFEASGAASPREPGRVAAIVWQLSSDYRANRIPQFAADVSDETLEEMALVLDQIYYYDLIGDVGKATELRNSVSTLPGALTALVGFRRADPRALLLMAGMVGIGKEGIGGRPAPAGGKTAPPSPNWRKGGIDHQQMTDDVVELIEARGLTARTEVRVVSPGGRKSSRYADVGAYDNGELVELHQVGRQTQGGVPVSRERYAFDDLELGEPDIPRYWHPYN